MKKLLLFIFVIAATQTSAQYFDKVLFVGWTGNVPVANRDFVESVTLRGGRIGYREIINSRVMAGIDLTTASYDKYLPRQTYYSSGSAITTDFTHWVTNYGATLSGEYLFREEQRLMPYVGLGLGVAYNSYKIYYNVFSSADNVFGFLARPRAGAWFRFSERSTWGVNVAVHVEYSTAKSEATGYKYFLNPGFEIGLVRLDW